MLCSAESICLQLCSSKDLPPVIHNILGLSSSPDSRSPFNSVAPIDTYVPNDQSEHSSPARELNSSRNHSPSKSAAVGYKGSRPTSTHVAGKASVDSWTKIISQISQTYDQFIWPSTTCFSTSVRHDMKCSALKYCNCIFFLSATNNLSTRVCIVQNNSLFNIVLHWAPLPLSLTAGYILA